MQAVILHVAADALNNIAVMVTAVIIWQVPPRLSESVRQDERVPAKYYADPACTLLIAIMIMAGAGPLGLTSGRELIGWKGKKKSGGRDGHKHKGAGEHKHKSKMEVFDGIDPVRSPRLEPISYLHSQQGRSIVEETDISVREETICSTGDETNSEWEGTSSDWEERRSIERRRDWEQNWKLELLYLRR